MSEREDIWEQGAILAQRADYEAAALRAAAGTPTHHTTEEDT